MPETFMRPLHPPRRKIRWRRPGCQVPKTPIGKWRVVNPEKAKQIIVKSLVATNGHVISAAGLVRCGYKRFYQFLTEYGLNKLPAELRKKHAARFRLPPAA
jgi:hypothetical protein